MRTQVPAERQRGTRVRRVPCVSLFRATQKFGTSTSLPKSCCLRRPSINSWRGSGEQDRTAGKRCRPSFVFFVALYYKRATDALGLMEFRCKENVSCRAAHRRVVRVCRRGACTEERRTRTEPLLSFDV
ncbi:unnamed protein product [Ixodes persulcatus]